MSLSALLIRLATVYALKGQTLAGANILDGPLDPARDAVKAGGPVMAIYADDTQADDIQGRDLLGAGKATLEVRIQTYLPDQVVVTVGGAPLAVDASGSGAAVAFNVLERQIKRALLAAQGPWAELWRTAVVSIHGATGQAFLLEDGKEDNRVRVAAHEFSLTVEPIEEPGFGEAPVGVWADFLALAATVPELAPVVAWLQAEASGPADMPEWQRQQASLGLTRAEVRLIGLAPPDDTEEATVPVDSATGGLDPAAVEVTADAATIEEQLPDG